MKADLKKILWIGLILSLLLSFPGVLLRVSNENNNKAVLPVIDYNDFKKAANEAGISAERILKQAGDAGIKAVALRETTLEDLNIRGDALVIKAGEYLSKLQGDTSLESKKLTEILNGKDFNPSSFLIVTSNQQTAAYLEQRLANRFESGKLNKLAFADKTIFHIASGIENSLNTGLGFDEDDLKKIVSLGFVPVLRPKNSPAPSADQITEYKDLITAYNVRYMIFEGNEIAGYPIQFDQVSDVITKNGIVTGIIEAPSQVRFVEQKGLEQLIQLTNYSINRVYITPQKDLEKLTASDMFHRWVRCVVDRNIRFIYIQPLASIKSGALQNIQDTFESAKKLNNFLVSNGYTLGGPGGSFSTMIPSVFQISVVLLSELIALLLYLVYLLGKKYRHILAAVLIVAASAFIAVMVLRFNIQQFLATFAAIIYPSFASLLVLRYFKNYREQALLKQIPALLAIMLGISLLGGYSIVTNLSDIRYTMNTEVYKGVLLSFAVPLFLFVVNYFACFISLEGFFGRVAAFMNRKVTFLTAIIAAVGAFAIILYLARSGNDSGISASALELKIRNVLEEAMTARPRFKEFLIGYPSLFTAALLYRKFKKDILLFPLGIGIAMGSVSIVNSFCHVFTAVSVSLLRTVNGFGLGIITGMAVITAIKLCIWGYDKLFRNSTKVC